MSSYEESNRSRRSYPQASSLAFSRSSTSQSPGELLTQSNMRQAGIPPPGDPVTLQPPPGFPAQVAPSQQTSRGGSTSSVQTAFRRPPAPRPPPPVGLPSRGSAQSSNGHRRLARPRPGPPSNCSSTDTGSQYGFQRSAGQPGAPSGYTPSARSLVSQSPEQVGYSQHGSSLRASQRGSVVSDSTNRPPAAHPEFPGVPGPGPPTTWLNSQERFDAYLKYGPDACYMPGL